jgi:hypothetical protein
MARAGCDQASQASRKATTNMLARQFAGLERNRLIEHGIARSPFL